MNYKDKLIELLKTDEVVKKDMEKLEFGCKVIIAFEGTANSEDEISKRFVTLIDYKSIKEFERIAEGLANPSNFLYTKIIGTLKERHLRMYCKNKGEYISIDSNGDIGTIENSACDIFIVRLNNTKDFDNQSEEVYKNIVEFLTK